MKRIPIVLSVLVVIVALFASTGVMANGNPLVIPTYCDFVDSNNEPSGMALEVLPTIDNQWPIMVDSKFKWNYQFTGSSGSSSSAITLTAVIVPQIPPVTTLAPVCYPEILTSLDGPTILSGTLFNLAQISCQGSGGTFPCNVAFYTNTNAPIGRTSLQLKTGGSTYFCRDIQGPVCPEYVPSGLPRDLIPLNTAEYKKLGQFDLRITRDGATWCAFTVEYFDPRPYLYDGTTPNPNYNKWVALSGELADIDGQKLISCLSPDGNQKCQECILYSASSPGCYTYSSGGRTYKVPAGCR